MGKPRLLSRSFQVTDGRRFRLASIDPGSTGSIESKSEARDRFDRELEILRELQEKLYAQDRWALLDPTRGKEIQAARVALAGEPARKTSQPGGRRRGST